MKDEDAPRSSGARTVQVKVKPSSRQAGVEEVDNGMLIARVKASPIDGKANKELVAVIARHFGVHKSRVSIKSGLSGRSKFVQIDEI